MAHLEAAPPDFLESQPFLVAEHDKLVRKLRVSGSRVEGLLALLMLAYDLAREYPVP